METESKGRIEKECRMAEGELMEPTERGRMEEGCGKKGMGKGVVEQREEKEKG